MQPSAAHRQFWAWFQANADRIRAVLYGKDHEARKRASAELGAAVKKVQDGLVLELGPVAPDGAKQLIVSADGRPEHVEAVKDFAESAPELAGWEVVAFRPRMEIGEGMEIQLEDQRVGPEDVWFRVEEDEVGLMLTLFIRGLTEDNKRLRGLGASLLAEHAVGERDALTMLSGLDAEPLPRDPAAAGLRPFRDLVAVFDEAKAAKYPPPGRLPLDPDGSWLNGQGTINRKPAMLLLNQAIQPLAGHPAYDRRLTVTIPFNKTGKDGMPATEEEYTVVGDLGDRVGEVLQQGQQSLLALVVMSDGKRELTFYTSAAAAALRRLQELRPQVKTHQLKAEVERDSFWGFYRSLCAGVKGEEEEE
jgi:hypothetical protein